MTNRNGHHWIRDVKRRQIYKRDRFRCVWCTAAVGPGAAQATLDHVLPRSKGGTNSHHNLITACYDCNSNRRDRNAIEYVFAQYSRAFACAALDRVIEAMASDLPSRDPVLDPRATGSDLV